MKQKLFLLLLAIVAGIGTMNAAIVNGTCGDNLTWSLNTKDSTLTIEGYGAMTSSPWAEYKEYISSITLPNGLTGILSSAFSGCSNISSISIPSTVTSIGDRAFANCSKITEIVLPNSVTSIGEHVFEYCSSLRTVTFPENLSVISDGAFWDCTSLTSVVIPNNVTTIVAAAFEGCSNLTSVTIPSSVASIGHHVFYGSRVNEIHYTGSFDDWCSKSLGSDWSFEDKWGYWGLSSSRRLFIGDTEVTTLIIPGTVTSIGNSFSDCHSLISLVISDGVISIGNNAFENCNNLAALTIANSVTSIGDNSFAGCSHLASVTIPSLVSSIGNSAFSNCNLTSVTCEADVPPTITSSTFSNKSILLFVPEGSIEAYQNALYWEEFTNIRAIGSAPLVQFIDWNGTVLSSANVTIGTAANPPADPTRTGYTFIGWDKDFSNITEDLVVTAQYQINRYKVDFIDWDNSILKTDSVDYNSAAVAPANPSREGHEFIGWDKDFSHVVSDMTITARYAVNYYPVGFLNYDGTLLSEQSIAYNQAAMEPEVPAREGYTFIGWTADITHITARTFAIALYEKQGLLLVTYKNEEGETISTENVDLHLPEAPEIEGFTFIGWQASGMLEEDGITIQAVYTADSQTSAPAVVVNPANKAQKLIRNGNVYILTDTKTYTIQGQVK